MNKKSICQTQNSKQNTKLPIQQTNPYNNNNQTNNTIFKNPEFKNNNTENVKKQKIFQTLSENYKKAPITGLNNVMEKQFITNAVKNNAKNKMKNTVQAIYSFLNVQNLNVQVYSQRDNYYTGMEKFIEIYLKNDKIFIYFTFIKRSTHWVFFVKICINRKHTCTFTFTTITNEFNTQLKNLKQRLNNGNNADINTITKNSIESKDSIYENVEFKLPKFKNETNEELKQNIFISFAYIILCIWMHKNSIITKKIREGIDNYHSTYQNNTHSINQNTLDMFIKEIRKKYFHKIQKRINEIKNNNSPQDRSNLLQFILLLEKWLPPTQTTTANN